jgi:hypothetical protein
MPASKIAKEIELTDRGYIGEYKGEEPALVEAAHQ